jgi:hypothetical protein
MIQETNNYYIKLRFYKISLRPNIIVYGMAYILFFYNT